MVLEHRRVNEVTESADACVVAGADFRIGCDAAVLTTHLPIVDPALIAGRMRPERSYAVAGTTGSELPAGMYIVHDAGWSLRPAESPTGPMLIVGGEGHSMTDHVNSERHYRALEELAGNIFDVDVAHRWSAFDYVTTDLLPYIGRLGPNSQRRFVATGFRKWGMTTSMLAGMIISDLISGTPNPYAATFDSTRILPAAELATCCPTLRRSRATGSVTGSEVPASRWHRSGSWRSAKAASRTAAVSPSLLRAASTARCIR